MSKQGVLTICLAIVALIGLTVGAILLHDSYSAKFDGEITVKVVEVDGSLVKEKKVSYKQGDTLINLVKSNFDNVLITDDASPMIMNIETLVTPSDWSKFISIKVNGEDSIQGVSQIEFKDGDVIEFVMTVFVYE